MKAREGRTNLTRQELDEKFVLAAKEEYQEEGTVEVDDGAVVSYSSDGGAYVQAWVWVTNDEAGVAASDNPEGSDS